jgi:RimJ/RimL family protein N-acetyltransferase
VGDRYLVFVWDSGQSKMAPLSPPDGYRATLWRPSWQRLVPPGDPEPSLYVWWLMHQLRGFRNRSYAALAVYSRADVAHRSLVFPASFVFPFMRPDDLQIGLVSTAPSHRRRGLAVFAIRDVFRRLERPGRRFWYLTEEGNEASVRTASAAGFVVAGTAFKHHRLGVRRLGSFELLPEGVAHDR